MGIVKLAAGWIAGATWVRYEAAMTSSTKSLYTGHRFPPELISYTVWLYFLFPLSLRMVAFVRAARLQCIVQSMASGDSPRTSACRG